MNNDPHPQPCPCAWCRTDEINKTESMSLIVELDAYLSVMTDAQKSLYSVYTLARCRDRMAAQDEEIRDLREQLEREHELYMEAQRHLSGKCEEDFS